MKNLCDWFQFATKSHTVPGVQTYVLLPAPYFLLPLVANEVIDRENRVDSDFCQPCANIAADALMKATTDTKEKFGGSKKYY